MKTNIYYTLIFHFLIFISCNTSNNSADLLKSAENYMQTSPDSALNILNKIESNSLSNDREKAIYSLLLSQAYDKNYIDLKSDSIINTAINYFKDRNSSKDKYYKMQSLYYLAKIHYNAKRFAESSIICSKAEALAKELKDNFYLGLIYGILNDIHNYTYNAPDELNYAQLSYIHFKKHGLEPYLKYSQLFVASAYMNNHKWDKCDSILDVLYTNATLNNDTFFIGEILAKKEHSLWNQKQYTMAKQILFSLMYKYPEHMESDSYSRLAHIYVNENKLDSAEYYINIGKQKALNMIDSATLKYSQIALYCAKDDYRNAFLTKEELDKIKNNSIYTIWYQSINRQQRDYFKENLNLSKQLTEKDKQLFIISIIILVLICLFLIIYLKQKAKIKISEMENKINATQELISKLNKIIQTDQATQNAFKHISNKQFDIIHQLCDKFHDLQSNIEDKKLTKISRQIISHINEFSSDPAIISGLESIANNINNDVIIKLKEQIPNIKKDDFSLLLYYFAGFSPKAISVFTQISLSNVYTRKSRLKKEIENMNIPDKELFLSILSDK